MKKTVKSMMLIVMLCPLLFGCQDDGVLMPKKEIPLEQNYSDKDDENDPPQDPGGG